MGKGSLGPALLSSNLTHFWSAYSVPDPMLSARDTVRINVEKLELIRVGGVWGFPARGSAYAKVLRQQGTQEACVLEAGKKRGAEGWVGGLGGLADITQ